MEWVETTGRTVDEAKEVALDELGVAEDEAEFEVVDEAKSGLFGRVRRPARVRARVAPRQPRPKVERRRRGRQRSGAKSGSGRGGRSNADRAKTSERATDGDPADDTGKGRQPKKSARKPAKKSAKKAPDRTTKKPARAKAERATTMGENSSPTKETKVTSDMTIQEQGTSTKVFLEGLLDAFGLDGDVVVEEVDDETLEIAVDGDDLGPLIGPKGQTLQAIQDLARASVQCAADGPLQGRTRLDIGGYRLRRREALERFAHQQADEVAEAGVERALEPMSAADRKVVHDAINEIDGVTTSSEGEDPRRRVVISPA